MEYFGHISYGELVMYKDLADEILKFYDPVKDQQKKNQLMVNQIFYQIRRECKCYKVNIYDYFVFGFFSLNWRQGLKNISLVTLPVVILMLLLTF